MNYSVNSKKLMHLRSIILPRRCIFKEVAAALLLMMMMSLMMTTMFDDDHNDHYHHPISHTHRPRQVAVKDMIQKFTVPYLTQTPSSCGKGCVLDSNFYNLVHKEYKSCLISATKKIISWTGFLLNPKSWHMDKDSINQT